MQRLREEIAPEEALGPFDEPSPCANGWLPRSNRNDCMGSVAGG